MKIYYLSESNKINEVYIISLNKKTYKLQTHIENARALNGYRKLEYIEFKECKYYIENILKIGEKLNLKEIDLNSPTDQIFFKDEIQFIKPYLNKLLNNI